VYAPEDEDKGVIVSPEGGRAWASRRRLLPRRHCRSRFDIAMARDLYEKVDAFGPAETKLDDEVILELVGNQEAHEIAVRFRNWVSDADP
jgi:hypothetical protein